jgi:ribosome-binding factor A
MTEGRRPRRVADTIRKYVADALARELFDPRLAGLVVTRVDIGSDLSAAKVYLRVLSGSRDDNERRQIEKAANRAAPNLRRGLGPVLGLKKLPELTFFYDAGQDAIERIEELLTEIQRETPPRSD